MDELTEQLWKQQREQRFVIVNAGQPTCPPELHCWSEWFDNPDTSCPHKRRFCRHCGCCEWDAKP